MGLSLGEGIIRWRLLGLTLGEGIIRWRLLGLTLGEGIIRWRLLGLSLGKGDNQVETVGDKDIYGRKGRGGCVGMFS